MLYTCPGPVGVVHTIKIILIINSRGGDITYVDTCSEFQVPSYDEVGHGVVIAIALRLTGWCEES